MDSKEIIPILQKNELTKDLSADEIIELLSFSDVVELNTSEMVFKENDRSRDLYLVIKGRLAVLKEMDDQFQLFGHITEGQFFGEMAHLEDEKRSASVQATEHALLLSIHLDKLQKSEKNKGIYAKIIVQLAKKVSSNLRRTDQTLIDSLKEKLRIMQTHNQVSTTLIHMVILLAVWFNLADITALFPAYRQELDLITTSGLLILFGISSVIVIKSSGYPLSFYGLTLKRWFPVSIEAVLYSIPFMGGGLLLKYLLIQNVKAFEEFKLFASLSQIKESLGLIFIYAALVPVQEIVARGCIQSCFRNFFQGPNRVFMAVLTSNLLFQMLHTTKDFWLAMGSLFFGFFWGILFETQKSVVGVSVSHAIIGVWSFFIIDYGPILDLARLSQGG